MNILIAAGVPKRREGGVAGVVESLAQGLERLGHTVTRTFLEDLVPARKTTNRFAQLQFSWSLARHIAQRPGEFSIVNLHAPAGLIYGLRGLLPSPRRPPYVVTLHGLEERLVYALKREVRKTRAWHFAFKNRLWHRIYHQPSYDWAIRTAQGAHCFSRDVWTLLQLKYDLDSERVAFIPNGVSEVFFKERQYQPTDSPGLLYVGTWLDRKGIFYLRDAFTGVTARHPEIRLTLAGTGVPASEIRQYFGEKMSGNLHIIESVPWDKMPELYADHDIFVLPSLMEGQPMALLEAMATGMPVVTTETCGMVDVVEDQVNGLLVLPACAAALREAILRLVESVEERRRLGVAAQQRMRRHSWDGSARHLAGFFERVIQNHSMCA